MPSRKSLSSDAAPSSDSRRSSMKRLSSIASLAHLNPFNRRRSANATDSINSLSSETSLPFASTTTTTATASSSRKPSESSSTVFSSDTAPLVVPNIPIESQASFLRRSSYICLPDDPIGGMPRSRTFSNLPLPTKHRKSESRIPSISHTRDPPTLPTPTRLPTPPVSTRRHLLGNLPVASSRYQSVRNRMRRSDTMPLLPCNDAQMSNLPRPTAFKENITLSPIRPLPELEPFDEPGFGTSLPPGAYMEDQLWEQPSATVLPRDPSFHGTLPVVPFVDRSPPREKFNSYSSPGYNTNFHPRTTSYPRHVPAQRWNSQPVLTNTTNVRAASHHEIRQTRLLSARQAPTPPPKQTPLSVQALGAPATRVRGDSVSSSVHHLRRSSTQTLLNISSTAHHTASQLYTAEPSAYWCGRMSALLDRYRNEDLAASLADLDNPRSESDKHHTPSANTARMRRALEHLYSLCATEEAKDSFVRFQQQWAATHNLPELSRPMRLSQPIGIARTTGSAPQDAVSGNDKRPEAEVPENAKGSGRKIGLLHRMLGRRGKRESHG